MRAAAAALAAALAWLAPVVALSASPPALALVRCACNPSALDALRDEIAAAETLGRAQELAAPPLRLARDALARARWMAPGGASLAAKERQLLDAEASIAAARSPDAVASAFSAGVAGPALPAAVGCAYTTLEIVAIVLGFILGILPGIILLIILC